MLMVEEKQVLLRGKKKLPVMLTSAAHILKVG
jgi:hypothetical protein